MTAAVEDAADEAAAMGLAAVAGALVGARMTSVAVSAGVVSTEEGESTDMVVHRRSRDLEKILFPAYLTALEGYASVR